MKHIHLIPADFEYYNLDDLIQERDNNDDGVCWSNEQGQSFNIGDIVYIYFHDRRGLTDRILLKATVYKSDCTDDDSGKEYEDRYLYSEYCDRILKSEKEMDIEIKTQCINDSKAKIKGFYLKDFYAINKEHKDDFVYKHGTREEAAKGLTGIMGIRVNQTKIYLDKHKEDKYEKLMKTLNNTKFNRNLNSLRKEYNDDSCIVCTESEKGTHTFLKQNNLFYFEIHHVLQQNFANKRINKKFSWFKNKNYVNEKGINLLVYSKYNEVRLCPYHHNCLHYGKIEKRKNILDKILKEQDYINCLKKIVKNENDRNEILKYIYQQYGIEFK